MLLALQSAITALLQGAFPALFTGAGAVQMAFADNQWQFDPMSADPVAGEPGPQDAVDALVFNPAAPTGPYLLTRPPYPGPRRVYLRTPSGDLAALANAELVWDAINPASFIFKPRTGRLLTGFDHLEAHYGVVAAGTQLKTLHQTSLLLTTADPARAEQALSLSLAALALNRERLRQQAAYSFAAGNYQVAGTLQSLSFASGSTSAAHVSSVLIHTALDLTVQRLLVESEGQPIVHISSPGRPAGGRPIDIDPVVQA